MTEQNLSGILTLVAVIMILSGLIPELRLRSKSVTSSRKTLIVTRTMIIFGSAVMMVSLILLYRTV